VIARFKPQRQERSTDPIDGRIEFTPRHPRGRITENHGVASWMPPGRFPQHLPDGQTVDPGSSGLLSCFKRGHENLYCVNLDSTRILFFLVMLCKVV
jgi:hypothetical protein